jgi:RND family efflux transporter MFP subunit
LVPHATLHLLVALLLLLSPGALATVERQPSASPSSPDAMPDPAALPDRPAWDDAAAAFDGARADTRPIRDVVMSFPFATEVAQVLVKGGQSVRKGDLLVRARDAEVVAALESQRSVAANDLEVQGAAAARELAEFRFEQLKRSASFSPSEFEELRIAALTARVQHDQAKFNLEQQRLRLAQLEAQAERFRLEAPFDGVIEQVLVEVGQGVNEQDDALRIVDVSSLRLDAFPPTDQTIRLNLQPGGPAWVLIDLPDRPCLVEGRIEYISPVADSVGLARRVRVEVENHGSWPAGTQAVVRFTPPGEPFEKYRAAPGRHETLSAREALLTAPMSPGEAAP